MDDIGYTYRKNDDSISYQYKPESAKCWLQIAHTVQELITAGGSAYRDYEGMVRYTLFFAAFFDAKMEYVEHGKSMKAVRKTLRTYERDVLGHKCFQKLAFGKEVSRISQGLWKVMIMVFRIYLEKGTQESFISVNKSEKFSRVGFLTKILGGN